MQLCPGSPDTVVSGVACRVTLGQFVRGDILSGAVDNAVAGHDSVGLRRPVGPPPLCTMTWPSASSRAITRRTVRSLMFALRAVVAADGQQPVPSSREHASARASSTRRSLPDVGEFAHTQFITAMLVAGLHCGELPAASVSDSGSEMGAEALADAFNNGLRARPRDRLTCADAHKQT